MKLKNINVNTKIKITASNKTYKLRTYKLRKQITSSFEK